MGDEGDSQSMTLSANQGNLEQDAAYKVEAFDVYEKMSLQSIGDESMPATHKRMLRQYFQSIRPQTQSSEVEPWFWFYFKFYLYFKSLPTLKRISDNRRN